MCRCPCETQYDTESVIQSKTQSKTWCDRARHSLAQRDRERDVMRQKETKWHSKAEKDATRQKDTVWHKERQREMQRDRKTQCSTARQKEMQ